MATGLKQRTFHHTLLAEPLREKAFEKSMRPSSLHISCARSAQRTFAKRARANMQAPFIFKSLHPGNDTSSLHNAQNMRRTTQPHEAIGSLGCSHAIFMLTQIVYQSGPQMRRRTVPLILPARKTHRPVLIGHCVTLLSHPAHAKAETWGAPFRTRCPHCVQKTLQNQQNPSPCKQPQPSDW